MPEAHRPQPATDRIRVSGLTATGFHGVFEHERRDGQTFVADVVLHVDTRPAAAEDRLDLTVDYGVLAEQVVAVLAGPPADLVETVAERIAAVALSHHAVRAVDVTVHKPQAPVPVPFTDVTVEIHRDRDHAPVVDRPGEVDAEPVAHLATGHAGGHEAHPSDADGAPDLLGHGAPDLLGHEATVADGSSDVDRSWGAGEGGGQDVSPPGGGAPQDAPPRDRLDLAPPEPVDVVLALGSNVGDSHDTLRRSVMDLAAVAGLEVTAVAPLARTQAVGGPEQPDFLNTVVLARTTLSPRALLHACQEIEERHGRVREEHWGPRTVDIDVVTHGSTLAVADDLELPHPRAHQRAFVLEPWAQVAPDAVLPGLGGGPVAALATTAPDRSGIRWMALDWWGAPEGGS